MRKFVAICIALVGISITAEVPAAQGNANSHWVKMGVASDNFGDYVEYMDNSSIEKSGNYVNVAVVLDYVQAANDGYGAYLSLKIQHQLDCANQRIREFTEIPFTGHMTKGDELKPRNISTAWEAIQPGGTGAYIYNRVCPKS